MRVAISSQPPRCTRPGGRPVALPLAARRAALVVRTAIANEVSTSPLVQLHIQAQAESEAWEAQLSTHGQQQQQLQQQLAALSRHQAKSHAALHSLRGLLHAARRNTKAHRLAVFAESVFLCGRHPAGASRSSVSSSDGEDMPAQVQPLDHHLALEQARLDAVQQLHDYDKRLSGMVEAMAASVAEAGAVQLNLPALVGDAGREGSEVPEPQGAGKLLPEAHQPTSLGGGVSNNIVPRRAGKKLQAAVGE